MCFHSFASVKLSTEFLFSLYVNNTTQPIKHETIIEIKIKMLRILKIIYTEQKNLKIDFYLERDV
jgi:hypothetical protein